MGDHLCLGTNWFDINCYLPTQEFECAVPDGLVGGWHRLVAGQQRQAGGHEKIGPLVRQCGKCGRQLQVLLLLD